MGGAASRARPQQAASKLKQAGQATNQQLAASRGRGGAPSPAAPDAWQPEPGEARDPVMGNFLDRLGGSIAARDVFPAGPQAAPSGRPAPPAAEPEPHRVSLTVLKQLLQDAQGRAGADAALLAERYGLEPGLVRSILRFNALPVYREDASGRVFGTPPPARPPSPDP